MKKLIGVLLAASLGWGPAAIAQTAPTPSAAPPAATRPAAAPRSILFIGNSFTYGATSPVLRFRANTVTDLNGHGFGGVPALFKAFTQQAGLNYNVSHEVQGGRTLGFHYAERRTKFDRAWDVVALQEHSLLNTEKPGDPMNTIRDAAQLAQMFTRANPKVDVYLMATWSRADLVYQQGQPWAGTPIDRMALDLRRAIDRAARASRDIDGVIPVGQAWNRAFATGVADPNPYDGISYGQVDLWGHDHYHASTYGYYLEALVVFGKVTGIDPRTLGPRENAAQDLGISAVQATALQRIAAEELAAR